MPCVFFWIESSGQVLSHFVNVPQCSVLLSGGCSTSVSKIWAGGAVYHCQIRNFPLLGPILRGLSTSNSPAYGIWSCAVFFLSYSQEALLILYHEGFTVAFQNRVLLGSACLKVLVFNCLCPGECTVLSTSAACAQPCEPSQPLLKTALSTRVEAKPLKWFFFCPLVYSLWLVVSHFLTFSQSRWCVQSEDHI